MKFKCNRTIFQRFLLQKSHFSEMKQLKKLVFSKEYL